MLETKRIAPGVFRTFWEGHETRYVILNGVMKSKQITNVYGYCWIDANVVDRKQWVGSLKDAKDKLSERIKHDILKGDPKWQTAA